MQWVGRALSSVSQYYKEINPATLSGAIDVIVVQHTNTKDGTTSLACSPFHVRFGKLSVLRPVDRTVYIKINDQDVPFHMKVGDTGEAFFVFETDQEVPADLQTSPLVQPVKDEQVGGPEPEPFDLGDSMMTESGKNRPPPQTSDEPPPAEEKAEIEGKHESNSSKLLEGATHKVAELGSLAGKLVTPSDKLDGMSHRRVSDAVKQEMGKGKAGESSDQPSQEGFLADEFQGTAPNENAPADATVTQIQSKLKGERIEGLQDDVGIGSEPRRLRRDSQESFDKTYGTMSSGPLVETPSSTQAEGDRKEYMTGGTAAPSETEVSESGVSNSVLSSSHQGPLMLDMAGYKTEGDAEGEDGLAEGAKTPPGLRDLFEGKEKALEEADVPPAHETDPDIRALTRALLRYSEAKSTGKELMGTATPDTASRMQDGKAAKDIAHDSNDPHIFVLLSEGERHTFEIAVSRAAAEHQAFGIDDEAFDADRITNEAFLKKPELLDDRHLMVRYRRRYFTWDNGSPALASLGIYRKALVDSQPKQPAAPATSSWKKWWGRGAAPRSRTATADSDLPVPLPDDLSKSPQGPPVRSASEPPMSSEPSPPVSPKTPASPTFSQAETVVDDGVNRPNQQTEPVRHYAKTLRLTSEQLKELNLKKGMNTMSFTVQSSFSGVAVITSRVFLWDSDYQVVISDIDGTITKSDALGHVFNMIGRDWTHPGVAKLYTDIAKNGYKMLYLTSRAVGQADTTREYLRGIQQDGHSLPEGPVIMSPDRLLTSLHREVVLRKPEVFKMACLRDIKRLFMDRNPFYAGFGNRLTDGLSYRSVEIPSSRIFTIDSYGNVKLELLELAGYTSTYIAMANLVDETFPPVQRNNQPAYNDFNYWRVALPEVELPDLAPPSPALSARSDSSRMSVFRVGAIAGALGKRASRTALRSSTVDGHGPSDGGSTRSPLSTSPRPSSPSPLQAIYHSDYDGEEDEIDLEEGYSPAHRHGAQRRSARRRADSMPGSYEDEAYLSQNRDESDLGDDDSERAVDDEEEEEDQSTNGQSSRRLHKVTGDADEDEDDGDDLEAGDGTMDDEDDMPEMDFGNVPYL